MDLRIEQIFSWKGELDRKHFFAWGLILFAIKYNLDRLIAIQMGRSWFIADYFIQADKASVLDLKEDDKIFYMALLIASLPFIWSGTVVCLKRLRNAALPGWLVVFFFVPFLNLIMFLLLSLMPKKELVRSHHEWGLGRLIPKSRFGSAAFSVVVSIAIALALMSFQIQYLGDYSWSFFVGVPFFLGFVSVLCYGYHAKLKYSQAFWLAITSVNLFGLVVFILAFEGIICIIMAFPIFAGVATIGASIAYAIQNNKAPVGIQAMVLPLWLLPSTAMVEHMMTDGPPTTTVVTELIIKAPKQIVWNNLVAFSRIDEPTELLFKTGIAYPIQAEINGSGVGSIRKCTFTTGSFIEPITTWDEPNLLAFGVIDQPPPMVEWSIYDDLQIEHLNGYFRSVKGQFKLEALADGNTRLIGTTWYHHNIWPSFYWKIWSDFILHRIHQRVLIHIKQVSEKN